METLSPPVLPVPERTSTPGTSAMASATLEKRLRSSSSRLTTEMLAGPARNACSKPAAVTPLIYARAPWRDCARTGGGGTDLQAVARGRSVGPLGARELIPALSFMNLIAQR